MNIKYLKLVCDLFDLDEKSFVLIGEFIEKNPDYNLFVSHPYGFIFLAFQKLIKNTITIEDFVQIGDIDSLTLSKNYKSSIDIQYLIEYSFAKDKNFSNTVFILDKKILNAEEIISIQKKLKKQKNYIFVL